MLRRSVDVGIAVTREARTRAEAAARGLAQAGAGWPDRLRREVSRQLSSMGLATKEDLARLETRIPPTVPPAPVVVPKPEPTRPGVTPPPGRSEA